MKPLFCTYLAFCLTNLLFGQTFSFQMNFEDAVGNKDSLIIGYDLSASDTIDASFGEVNIISLTPDSIFEVRISDEWPKRFNSLSPTFHTKKQIIQDNCGGWNTVQAIDIYAKYWPVKATWDNLLFNDTCRNGSVFTSTPPGGWFDVASPSDLGNIFLKYYNSATFSTNSPYTPSYAYVNTGSDTIPVYWMTFADSTLMTVSVAEIGKPETVSVYPNPSSSLFNFSLPAGENKIYIYNILGKLIYSENSNIQFLKIDLTEKPNGIYLFRVENKKELVQQGKLLKIGR